MKGLLFKPWKAQAIHESNPDIEWQTRRKGGLEIINQSPDDWYCLGSEYTPGGERWHFENGTVNDTAFIKCPFSVGDEVYIKETWAIDEDDQLVIFYKGQTPDWGGKWHSPLFMPAWAARTVVAITDIRAPRVQDISENDALAEGVTRQLYNSFGYGGELSEEEFNFTKARFAFRLLWDSIHGSGAWARNDWVWKYSFIRRDYADR